MAKEYEKKTSERKRLMEESMEEIRLKLPRVALQDIVA